MNFESDDVEAIGNVEGAGARKIIKLKNGRAIAVLRAAIFTLGAGAVITAELHMVKTQPGKGNKLKTVYLISITAEREAKRHINRFASIHV